MMRNKLNSNPHAMRGDAVLAFLIIAIGSIMLLLYLPLALLQIRYMYFVTSTLGLLLVIIGWGLLSSARLASRQDTQSGGGKQSAWEMPLTIGTILLVGLWGFWVMKSGQWDQWEDKDEAERAKAPVWTQSLDTLEGGMRWEDIRDRLGKEGYRMRCYAVGPNEGMMPGDTHACWTVAKTFAGIPVHTLSFLFGKEGLRQVRIDFAKEEWPAVKAWYDHLDGEPTGTFGQDQGGNTITGKLLKTGQVLTAEPNRMPNLMVLWQARSMLEQTVCNTSQRDRQWELLCNPSKP